MAKRHSQATIDRAHELYLKGGCDLTGIANACGVGTFKTIQRWIVAGGWEAERDAQDRERGYVGPLAVQENLVRVAGEEISRLLRQPTRDVAEVCRWEDISNKANANIRLMYELANDAEIYVRTLEMMVRHLGSFPEEQRQTLAEVIEPFFNSFELAIRSGKVRPE